jgi:hypothetical protein
MGTALIFSEIVFNLTVSLAVMVVGGLLAVIAYHLISMVRELKELSGNLNNASAEAVERINEVVSRLSELPILSYFLGERPARQRAKGRPKIINNKQNNVKK